MDDRSLLCYRWYPALFGRRRGKAQLPVLLQVAVSTEGHKVPEGVVALLAFFDLVVDLQILQRAALLTSPVTSLQHALLYPAVALDPQLDPLSPWQLESRT